MSKNHRRRAYASSIFVVGCRKLYSVSLSGMSHWVLLDIKGTFRLDWAYLYKKRRLVRCQSPFVVKGDVI